MESINSSAVRKIRSFNRFYTEVLGLLNKHIFDSNYSLTEVRILFEIGKAEACSANMLMERLNIDRGYMSRILKKFEAEGLIIRKNSSTDGRKFFLYLTSLGKNTLSDLEEKSDKHVQELINHLTQCEQENLIKSMNFIRNSLMDGINPVSIRTYQQKDIEYIIKRHRELYEIEYGFNDVFGDYVEGIIHTFNECNDINKENIWVAEIDDTLVGVIAIVKVDDSTAQLRWFLIEPEIRGRGVGHKLIKTALDFCKERQYKHIFLWTASILDTARRLYKNYGFELTEAKNNDSWGKSLTEERWDLYL